MTEPKSVQSSGIICPQCGEVPDPSAMTPGNEGKPVRCPNCRTMFRYRRIVSYIFTYEPN